jgi:hypothetical protein
MQVFIVGTPLETAMALDRRRLNKQIIECGQILDALNGKKAWSNHPCTLQYKSPLNRSWLINYLSCLSSYVNGRYGEAMNYDEVCEVVRPIFHAQEYFDQMKRRLYTKDKEHYKQWAYLGESDVNWYWSHEKQEFIKYRNGKRIE